MRPNFLKFVTNFSKLVFRSYLIIYHQLAEALDRNWQNIHKNISQEVVLLDDSVASKTLNQVNTALFPHPLIKTHGSVSSLLWILSGGIPENANLLFCDDSQ